MTTSPSRRRSWTPTSMTTTPAVLGTSVRSRRTCARSIGGAIAARPPRIDLRIRRRTSSARPSPSPSSWRRGRTRAGRIPTENGARFAARRRPGRIAVVSSTAPSTTSRASRRRAMRRNGGSCTCSRSRGSSEDMLARGVVGLSSHLLDGRFPGRGAPSSRHAERVRDALRSGRSISLRAAPDVGSPVVVREHAPGLPILVKGILTAEDATLAVEHQVDATVVSNHGGRQLDSAWRRWTRSPRWSTRSPGASPSWWTAVCGGDGCPQGDRPRRRRGPRRPTGGGPRRRR